MSATCQACGGRAQLFLCPRCESDLREHLRSLLTQPDDEGRQRLGLLEYLDDAAIGGRGRGKSLIEYTDPEHGDEKLDRALANGEFHRDKVLAAGGVNAKASRLRASVAATLSALARSIADTRGVIPTPQKAAESLFVGPLLPGWRRLPANYAMTTAEIAWWLSENAQAIALDEAAGEHHADISRIVGDILRVINPPTPPRFCGPCPSTIDRAHGQCQQHHPHPCGNRLMAPRTAIEVTCRSCRETHNVERLIKRLLADVDHWRFDRAEILLIMETLDERLNERTFRRWRAAGKVRPSGYRRPDGSIGITRRGDADEPLYRLSDVRKLWRTGEAVVA
jgi:hypothetical protein